MRNKTSDLQTLCSYAQTLSLRDSMLSVTYDKVHITCVLHTAGIINVDSIMSVSLPKAIFLKITLTLTTGSGWRWVL